MSVRCQQSNRPSSGPWLRASGLSLVEMMVALAVGLILLAGLMQVWSSSRQTYRLAEAQSRAQENGRFAAQLLAKDLRSTRSLGCRSIALDERYSSLNVIACELLDTPAEAADCTGPASIGSDLAMGYDASQHNAGAWLDALPGDADGAQGEVEARRLRGAVIVSWGAVGDGVYLDAPGGIGDDQTGTIDVWDLPTELDAGSLALITDCSGTDVFEITSVAAAVNDEEDPDSSTPAKIRFDAGGDDDRKNSSNRLSRSYNWIGSDLSVGPSNRARVYPFEYRVFFVCCMDSDDGTVQLGAANVDNCNTDSDRYRPALCRWSTATDGETRQLVADVADMRVSYSGTVGTTQFRDLGADAVADWSGVDSIRVQLLATWGEQVLIEPARPNNWRDNQGGDLGFGMAEDRRLYQSFDLTVATRASVPWYVQ